MTPESDPVEHDIVVSGRLQWHRPTPPLVCGEPLNA